MTNPTRFRWAPATFEEAQNDIDHRPPGESHYLELRSQIMRTESIRKLLSAMSIDGGTIVYGIKVDKQTRLASGINPVRLDGEAERIQQIAHSLDPALTIAEPLALASPSNPEVGIIVVNVPASTTAPHLAVAEQHRRDLTRFVVDGTHDEPFTKRVVRSVHDFGFYCRQHAPTLTMLHEEQLRDLLLIPQQQLFSAEGEAKQYRGKTDIKVVNPDNRYEIVVVELKVWDGEVTVAELLEQGFHDHVTGQEAHIVLQMISRRQDFGRIVEMVRHLVQEDPAVLGPLSRVDFGSKEHLFESTAVVHEDEVPFTLSVVDLSTTPASPRSARSKR